MSTTIDTKRPNVTEVRAAIVYNLFHQHWTNTSGGKKPKNEALSLDIQLIRTFYSTKFTDKVDFFVWITGVSVRDKNDEWVSDRLFVDTDYKWKNKSIKNLIIRGKSKIWMC